MKAFYAGSFDPFTTGHLSIANRALEIFGELIIGIGFNKSKQGYISVEERLKKIRKIFKDTKGLKILAYDGLTAEAAKQHDAKVLVRGVRNAIDFVKEKELADINLEVFGIPTVFIPSVPGKGYVSSSMVRELKHFGQDISEFVPDGED